MVQPAGVGGSVQPAPQGPPALPAPTWSIVQFGGGRDDTGCRVGVLAGGVVRALPPSWPSSAFGLLQEWDRWSPGLRELDLETLAEVPEANLVAPITFPRKVIGAGANYYDHAQEMGTSRPDPGARPFFFLKPPSTAVVGPGAHIQVPDLEDAGLDWEVELAVVIGRRCRGVPVAQAREVIAGYTVATDLSARRRFPRPDAVAPPFGFDWLQHKGFDGSCPLGPGIVPSWAIPDAQALAVRLTVNQTVKQDSSTRDMVLGVDALVAGASAMVTLEAGDVILTGTPAGVGMPREDFLRAGDVVVAEIEAVGRLVNTIEEG